MPPPEEELSPEEAFSFLHTLFPGGLKNPALANELCPEGWVNSPLHLAFHPTPDQRYEEHIQMCKNLNRFQRIGAKRRGEEFKPEPTPTFEEFQKSLDDRESPPNDSPADELAELIGLCLWDIFSDNHDVFHSDGRIISLGSFRGAGGTIADFVGELTWDPDSDLWERGFDYMRYYMGSYFIGQRTSLVPVYEMVFHRLKELGCNWSYSFPRLHAFSFQKPVKPESDYSPSKALQQQQDEVENAREENRLRKALDKSALEAKREARRQPPPETVVAYLNVFQCFPVGWPPDPYDPS
jgi:hypothetical protein